MDFSLLVIVTARAARFWLAETFKVEFLSEFVWSVIWATIALRMSTRETISSCLFWYSRLVRVRMVSSTLNENDELEGRNQRANTILLQIQAFAFEIKHSKTRSAFLI